MSSPLYTALYAKPTPRSHLPTAETIRDAQMADPIPFVLPAKDPRKLLIEQLTNILHSAIFAGNHAMVDAKALGDLMQTWLVESTVSKL
jgi:hypothetical protein